MNKCKLLAVSLALMPFAFYGQSEEEITLPDVSTVISGGAPKAGKSAVPDFTEILPSREESQIVPRLPDASGDNLSGAVSSSSKAQEKSIYAEGLAGLGYPGFFTGNFSIYRESGLNPFRITFGHETVNGYAGNSLTSGYFDKKTGISAEKTFTMKNSRLFLNGKYESLNRGLQGQCENLNDVTNEIYGAGTSFEAQMKKGFVFESSVNGSWYKRYGSKVSSFDLYDFAEKASVLNLNPEIGFGWNHNGFSTMLNADYALFYDINDNFEGRNNTNRLAFTLNLGWQNDSLKLSGSACAVLGNGLNDNEVVVPFMLGADFGFVTPLSERKVRASVEGGIDSKLSSVSSLEEKYRFSCLEVLPEEESDWYGKLGFILPVKDVVSLNFDAEFRKTAFDNGVWSPHYDEDLFYYSDAGQYLFLEEDMTQFNTDLSVSFRYGIASFLAGWKVFWADVPETEDESAVNLAVSLQDKKSRVVFSSDAVFALGSDSDKVPEIGFELAVKLSNAVRLAVNGTDVVKLITGTERDYAGKYIERSGTIGILAKFFF